MGRRMREWAKRKVMQFENCFFSRVVKRALGMMIPLILVGGLACALRDLPIGVYQELMERDGFHFIYEFLNLIYEGTFGLFSIALVVGISLSYAMELNVTMDYVVMYVIVSLTAFGAQLNIGGDRFEVESLGTFGCFSAILVTYLSCMAYTALRKVKWMTLERVTAGMGGISVPAIQTFLPLVVIGGTSGLVNQILYHAFHVNGCHELLNGAMLDIFRCVSTSSNFMVGLLYTFLVNVLWFFGLHGSHILEPVAQQGMAFTGDTVFSKSFYDVFVSMGGCGTTICVLIALLIFFRKERAGKLGKIAGFTVVFNLNEMLTFGLPIILNPIMFLPFVLTPLVCYLISYASVSVGLVPMMTREVAWSVPVGFGGYLATGSLRGAILQFVCIAIGVAIYLPFLRMNQKMEIHHGKERVKILIRELQGKEERIEQPMFLTRGDYIGTTSRLLLDDLKHAVRNKELFMLYQPQVDADGHCIGAEALLRWEHPLYGMIYPPLIIYLAEEGKILPELEKFILEEVARDLSIIQEQYDGKFKVSVNFTAHSLLWDVEVYVDEMLKKYKVEPQKLWIEITEQDILLQTDVVTDKLKMLKDAGHKLLIDDFGMGHTSLLYLQSEYFDIVKLDGSLVKPLLTSKTNQKIVGSIAKLADELNVGVIAEYVETKEQQELLHTLGCDCYQGYYYSKPIPRDEFITYIKK